VLTAAVRGDQAPRDASGALLLVLSSAELSHGDGYCSLREGAGAPCYRRASCGSFRPCPRAGRCAPSRPRPSASLSLRPRHREVRESDRGQLVADWVELFAPVVFEPHRPSAWPAEGSLLLDHLPFRVRALDAAGRRIPAGRVAFDVFCAVGYVAGRPRLSRAEAFPTAHPTNWSAFLASLPGRPKRIVCDAPGGMLQAISERWPETELHQCEWHLQHALERLLAKEARRNPSEELEELRARAEGALTGPSFWRPVVRAARSAENESLDRWIAGNGPTIEAQFARRPPPSKRPADTPLTTSALEQITRPIVTAVYSRRYGSRTRERLKRLVLLVQLHVNGDDDVPRYATTIRRRLETNGGRPTARRRAIADPLGSPSLR
jgi:hypothetical protein